MEEEVGKERLWWDWCEGCGEWLSSSSITVLRSKATFFAASDIGIGGAAWFEGSLSFEWLGEGLDEWDCGGGGDAVTGERDERGEYGGKEAF